MYRVIFLLTCLILLLFQPVLIPLAQDYFDIYLEPLKEVELMVGMLKILVMFLCCFVMNELPWKPICTKLFAVVISVVSIVLAYNYVNGINNDIDSSKVIQVERSDGGER